MDITHETPAPVTETIARFVCSADLTGARGEIIHHARDAVIDTAGVAIAGRHEACFTILAETLGGGGVSGEATVLPTQTRTTAAQAALLNGTAGHALDYDDVADQMRGHPSVVLVSALLALAEATGRSGREVLEAYAIGFQVACAVARGLPIQPHYAAGWHATATIGILGAVAGASRLLGLDETRARNALGIAASMASGSRQNFGTMTKPLHAGLTARDAVVAAQLAANGFSADQQQLEGPLGYFRMYGVNANPRAVVEALAEPNQLLGRGLSVKKYPCCYELHRATDAALALRSRGVAGANVRSITMTVQPGGSDAIIHHRPNTGLQGKFSAEYALAACLLDGRVGLSTFTDQSVRRPEAQDLLRRVTIVESQTPPLGPPTFDHAYAVVELGLADGSSVRERCDVPRGDARAPLSSSDLEDKFRDCLDFAQSEWDTQTLLECLGGLDSPTRVGDALRDAAGKSRQMLKELAGTGV